MFLLRYIALCCASFYNYQLYSQSDPSIATTMPIIAITQIVAHPSLDKIRRGIIDEINAIGYHDQKNCQIIYENAQGNIAIAAQIAQKFVALNPKVIIAIATSSAQTVQQAAKSTLIPIVFGAVTDPIEAKLIKTLDDNGGNITGSIDRPEAAKQLSDMKKLLPDLKTLGVIYSPSESNSVQQVEAIKRAAFPIEIILFPVVKSADVGSAAQAAAAQVDAIFVPNDNNVISAFDTLILTADVTHIPVFASDPDSIERGAYAATANDQYQVGRETGKLVVAILQGRPAASLSVKKIDHVKTYVNQQKRALFQSMLKKSGL